MNKNILTTRDEFIINSNFIYWSLTKSKQVIKSVFTSKIFSIVTGADIAFTISFTLKIIIE